jgi:hypothetical protein
VAGFKRKTETSFVSFVSRSCRILAAGQTEFFIVGLTNKVCLHNFIHINYDAKEICGFAIDFGSGDQHFYHWIDLSPHLKGIF